MTTATDTFLTPQEAASLLQIEAQTLAAWACSGRYSLPFVRIGRAIRYRLSDLEAFIQSRRQTCTVAAR